MVENAWCDKSGNILIRDTRKHHYYKCDDGYRYIELKKKNVREFAIWKNNVIVIDDNELLIYKESGEFVESIDQIDKFIYSPDGNTVCFTKEESIYCFDGDGIFQYSMKTSLNVQKEIENANIKMVNFFVPSALVDAPIINTSFFVTNIHNECIVLLNMTQWNKTLGIPEITIIPLSQYNQCPELKKIKLNDKYYIDYLDEFEIRFDISLFDKDKFKSFCESLASIMSDNMCKMKIDEQFCFKIRTFDGIKNTVFESNIKMNSGHARSDGKVIILKGYMYSSHMKYERAHIMIRDGPFAYMVDFDNLKIMNIGDYYTEIDVYNNLKFPDVPTNSYYLNLLRGSDYLQQIMTIMSATINHVPSILNISEVNGSYETISSGYGVTRQVLNDIACIIIERINDVSLNPVQLGICISVCYNNNIHIRKLPEYIILLIVNSLYFCTDEFDYHNLLKMFRPEEYNYYHSQYFNSDDTLRDLDVRDFKGYLNYIVSSGLSYETKERYRLITKGFIIGVTNRNIIKNPHHVFVNDLTGGIPKYDYKFKFSDEAVGRTFLEIFLLLTEKQKMCIVSNITGAPDYSDKIYIKFQNNYIGLKRMEYDDELEMNDDSVPDLITDPKENSIEYKISACTASITIYLVPTRENLTNLLEILSVTDNKFHD